MDRLHAGVPVAAASVAAADVRVSFSLALPFSPALPFGPRFWWYDVHQVEGAV
jgi:hypothetical protein